MANCMSDSGEFQEIESITVENFITFPFNKSPRSMLSRDKRLPLDTWNLSEPQGNVFGNPRPVFDSS